MTAYRSMICCTPERETSKTSAPPRESRGSECHFGASPNRADRVDRRIRSSGRIEFSNSNHPTVALAKGRHPLPHRCAPETISPTKLASAKSKYLQGLGALD